MSITRGCWCAWRSALIADLDTLARTVDHPRDIAELVALGTFMMEAVDLTSVAQQSVAAMAPLAFRQRRTLEPIPDGPNIIEGRPQFIARALGALIENAVEHGPAGSHITIDTREGGVISVADDGPWMAASDQELVFRRFWRRDRAAAGDSGSGLAIVRRVANVHLGTVALLPQPGPTVFTVRFPSYSTTRRR